MPTHNNLNSLFTDIADAIRDKTGSTDNIKADDFPTAISEISAGNYLPQGTKFGYTTLPCGTSAATYFNPIFKPAQYFSPEDRAIIDGEHLFDNLHSAVSTSATTYKLEHVLKLDLTDLDLSQTAKYAYMFQSAIVYPMDLTITNTNYTGNTFNYMFSQAQGFQNIELNITMNTIQSNGQMSYMFDRAGANGKEAQSLKTIKLNIDTSFNPSFKFSSSRAFYGNYYLRTIELGDKLYMSIDTSCADTCKSLTAFVIRYTGSVYTLANTNAFANCTHILGTTDTTYNPTGAKDGYIYVPDSLVDQYKAANNWSTYASQIRPLSQYTGA